MDDKLPIGTTISHYRITKFIDEGGQGKVYLADDLSLNRQVALKILSPELSKDEKRLRHFEKEAKTASQLNHPHIVIIYEIGNVGPMHYIAEEYVEGITVNTCLRKRRKLTVAEALRIAIRIASALEAAHAKGVVHRDIKPRNLMLQRDGKVKVIDFGIAKLIERTPRPDIFASTGPTERLVNDEPADGGWGTPHYMSPEQLEAGEVDERTDVWSLGVVLYEMVAGRRPFRGDTFNELRKEIVEGTCAPLTQFPHKEPEGMVRELQRIIAKTLRKDKDKRYQVIKDLRIDLEDLLESLERYVPPPAEGVRYDRRRRARLFAWLVLLTLALGVLVYSYAPWRDEPVDSLAVLPFKLVNKSAAGLHPELEQFSGSITNRLSQLQLSDFRVAPPITGNLPRKDGEVDLAQVHRTFNVKAVLTGEITQLDNGDVRVNVSLVDVRKDREIAHLWGHQYDRKISSLLSVQQGIVDMTLDRLKLKLTAEAQARAKGYTNDEAAYRAYLRGSFHLNKRTKEGFQKGIEAFQEAVRRDENYAQAHAGLADCHALNSFFSFVPPKGGYLEAEKAAEKALRIDGKLAEAHTSLAYTKAFFYRDWAGAEDAFRTAIELNRDYVTAHHWYGLFLARVGRFEEADHAIKRAQQLNPMSLIVNRSAGLLLYYTRRYDEAIEEFKKVLDLDRTFVLAHSHLGVAYAKKGMFDEAIASLRNAEALSPESTNIIAELGWAYGVAGRKPEALKILARLEEMSNTHYVSPYSVAVVYTGLGDRDRAFEALDHAFAENSDKISLLGVEPILDALRADPRFEVLLQRARFPQQKVVAGSH
ncbi:MAG TPA: protein kinase [Pyrinomonadaceae bacterium]|nr:protein kinase [Pyrinomonadaceae bacterium]